MANTSNDYITGFREGFEFLLLALEGRMELMDEASAEELAPFIDDYRRLGEMLQQRGTLTLREPMARVVPKGRIYHMTELEPSASN